MVEKTWLVSSNREAARCHQDSRNSNRSDANLDWWQRLWTDGKDGGGKTAATSWQQSKLGLAVVAAAVMATERRQQQWRYELGLGRNRIDGGGANFLTYINPRKNLTYQ